MGNRQRSAAPRTRLQAARRRRPAAADGQHVPMARAAQTGRPPGRRSPRTRHRYPSAWGERPGPPRRPCRKSTARSNTVRIATDLSSTVRKLSRLHESWPPSNFTKFSTKRLLWQKAPTEHLPAEHATNMHKAELGSSERANSHERRHSSPNSSASLAQRAKGKARAQRFETCVQEDEQHLLDGNASSRRIHDTHARA